MMTVRSRTSQHSTPNIHQTNPPTNGPGERVEDIHGRIQPFGQLVVDTARLVECRDLLSEQREDRVGRIAGFEFGK